MHGATGQNHVSIKDAGCPFCLLMVALRLTFAWLPFLCPGLCEARSHPGEAKWVRASLAPLGTWRGVDAYGAGAGRCDRSPVAFAQPGER